MNASITSGALAGGWTVIDFAGDPTIGAQASYNGYPTVYSNDGIHPTTLNCSYMAQVVATAFNGVV